MAIVIKFKHLGFSRAKYHEVIKQLENAGQGNPVGRFYHVCYGNDNEVDILDVWDNREDFNAFGETLIPILNAMDVQLGEPDIQEIFGVIIG
ncbi:hypothetical protein [Flavobacterium daejeonense]|uniref:hypothetical protein n=1 Tax=Flavobacterium daejeonense TaxID=350893 RepID=UPI00047B5348|nr:hypothetical protein [Flavobacterium daejeonense]